MKKITNEVKNYLKQIKTINNSIRLKRAELEELREMAAEISAVEYSSEKVKSSRKSTDAPYVSKVIRITALEQGIEDEIAFLSEKKHEILSSILCMENDVYSQILSMHYVDMKSFEEISAETEYSYQYVINLHRKALRAFGEIYLKINIQTEKSA